MGKSPTLLLSCFQSDKLTLAKELSDTVIYCRSVHFTGFEESRQSQAFYEMSSFVESKGLRLAQESGASVLLCQQAS